MSSEGPPSSPNKARNRPPSASDRLSFREYLKLRKYDHGRGSVEAWKFIALARGDSGLPEIECWRDLENYLEANREDPELIRAALSVWRSFTAYRSRNR